MAAGLVSRRLARSRMCSGSSRTAPSAKSAVPKKPTGTRSPSVTRDRSPRMVSPIKASARQPRSQPVHHRNCRRCAAFRAISAQFSPEAVPRAVTADSPAARKWPDIIRPLPNTTGTLSPGSASEQPWPRGRAQGVGRCWAQGRPRRCRTSRRSRNLDRPGCPPPPSANLMLLP
jgi:hypothetical protein